MFDWHCLVFLLTPGFIHYHYHQELDGTVLDQQHTDRQWHTSPLLLHKCSHGDSNSCGTHSTWLVLLCLVLGPCPSWRVLVSHQEACGHGLRDLVCQGVIHELFHSKPFDEGIGTHGSKMHFQWGSDFWDLLL